ncbi:hypothetical protein [Nocardioides hwasunensis]|uniref:PPE domain-containing protein n=1 Tax=Nocardioides hwasunensis TaxID=397258 RepID=A0ABR8MLF2_9ACTN|nr:hypothetical protein [Nocardioides hwasunensis]MBD3916856.1 hypothetical protein [Nocardioides hwasunensis]
MPANPWELRADVLPLEAAAARWDDIGAVMRRRGDEIVVAARRATEGWDAEAAESYDRHRRQVLDNLDRFTTLAIQISGCLRAISAIMTASQKELDQSWTKVAMVPHESVGESRYLVFRPSEDDERTTVDAGQQEADDIRRRLNLSLDQEGARLRSARAELVTVRTSLMTLAGGYFPQGGVASQDEVSGVGTIAPPSTSVPGSAQAGAGAGAAAALGPIAPVSVSVPDLTGLAVGGLAPVAASAASMLGRRRGGEKKSPGTVPPVGGMGAGGMAARAGTMSRGMASGRSGPARLPTPKLQGQSSEDDAARVAREKAAAKDAKRAAIEEKRAERAARKAEREKEKKERDEHDDGVPSEDVVVGSDREQDDAEPVSDPDADPRVDEVAAQPGATSAETRSGGGDARR